MFVYFYGCLLFAFSPHLLLPITYWNLFVVIIVYEFVGCFQFSTSRTVLLKTFSLSVQTFTHLHLVCPWAWKTHGYLRSLSARCQTALRSGGTNSHCRRPSSLPLGIVHLVRVRPPAERVARPPCNLIPYLSAECHVPRPRLFSVRISCLCFYFAVFLFSPIEGEALCTNSECQPSVGFMCRKTPCHLCGNDIVIASFF